ncbi:phospholipase A2 [Deinococcus sp. AB2017081]|uniref:phospholipase A2 n=1 Tax=Deinococcus sp. AB2017081 TaxID=3093660 RepID=UPI002ACC2D48|nr:phospholipase A2 [Deinococcus sp. AB2017081]WQE95681.1 phospholipase A2 [Deinococcus sp. AB2017081]
MAPGDLPPGGLDYVRTVAWGSVEAYEQEYARHAGTPQARPGVDWFRNGCADHLTLGHVRDFTAACGQHDFGYRNLRLHAATRTAADRRRTDDVLYAHMREVCAAKDVGQRPSCEWTAAALYRMVRVFGGLYFIGR